MAQSNPVSSSGDGTRPTTDGGVDNIGAGEKFTGKQTPGGDVAGPAPKERMSDKRSDVRNAKHDDLDIFGMHEEQTSETNREPVPRPEEMPVNQPKD
ncbi:hypothetical protein [Variovorax sp. ZT4R33]|uniref:hypothetical protein n=1 Tax=Variovorax sp. ZT4R33 TaxID=3443743 RepID=UPI003F477482